MLKKEDERKECANLTLGNDLDNIISDLKEILDLPSFISYDIENIKLMFDGGLRLPKQLIIKNEDSKYLDEIKDMINYYNEHQPRFICELIIG